MSAVGQGENLRFDEVALEREENKELYLFQWLRNAETTLKPLSPDVLKQEQTEFVNTIIKILTGISPFPQPGRPLRSLATRVLIHAYQKGETRALYDALQTFIKVAGDVKSTDIDLSKIACFYALGECMEKLHSQIASFITDIALIAIKTSKSTSNSPLLRLHAIKCLRKSIAIASRAITDGAMKEVLKQARNLLSDKVFSVQAAASELLTVLYAEPDPTRTSSDIESIVQLCVKSLDVIDRPTRNAFSCCVGSILASSQVQKATPPPETNKKSKGKDKEADADDDIVPPPISTDAPKTIMSVQDMLGVLSSHFNKLSTTRKTRLGLLDFYASLFTALGPSFVESNYASIVKHLMESIVTYPYPRNLGTRHDKLLVRHGVSILLRDLIAVRMLSEGGQIGAVRELSNNYLKKWPALLPGDKEIPPEVLVIVLREVSGLVAQMGNAPPPAQDALQQPLIQLLAHSVHSVRVAAAWALRSFCFSTPLKLPKLILNVMELLQKDITALSNPNASVEIMSKSLGHAYGLAALFAVIPERPLYISYDLATKALDMAIQLLKRSSDHDIKVADVEMEVAWICISSLMALGPNFVKAHLPQLLVLWRNAIPKPTSKDTTVSGGRSLAEWMFLLHVRECALGAIFSFLRHNAPTIVSLDVTRRLSSLLSNAVGFANSFISVKSSLDIPDSLSEAGGKGVTPASREASLRRRAYDCFSLLGTSTLTDSAQTTLLQSAISLFGSHEGYAGSAAQAAIASSSGSLQSIWQAGDGYGYGVTSLNRKIGQSGHAGDSLNLDADSIELSLEQLHNSPVLPSCEHDPLVLCDLSFSKSLQNWPEPMPPTTAVVDSSIKLFAQLLPAQDVSSAFSAVNQLVTEMRSPRFEKNVGRKAAVQINSTTALVITLQSVMDGSHRSARETLGQASITSAITNSLKDTITDGDPQLRSLSSEAIGRLTSLGGTTLLTKQVKVLVDTVVNNRDPSARAGCALAFGAIHMHVGGMAVGPLLKTTVNILMSLSTDPHPVVHYWALRALSHVVDAASLSYAPFISGTLGMLYNSYSLASHEDGGGSLSNANFRSTLPTHEAICHVIDNVIAVMGPELQESSQTRSLILDMVNEFRMEDGNGIKVEAIKCIQHFLLFAADCVDLNDLVDQLRALLGSQCQPLKEASINALYQLVQKDALLMSKLGGDQLVENLFRMLDEDAAIEGVRSIIVSWLKQTAGLNPSAWIDLCQRILSRTGVQSVGSRSTTQRTTGLRDEEGESLGIDLPAEQTSSTSGLTSRWRTQLFSLRCLHFVFETVTKAGRPEHFNIGYARSQRLPTAHLLVSRVTDLIKMAFTASAAHVSDIRLEGLVVLRDIIESFANSPDPDYSEVPLLEQHQAPITAALTPAFSSDSTPEILAAAIQVCGVFVGSGIVKEVKKMGRILKLLTTSLEQAKESGTLTIGEVKQLSPNASVMLRIATATAWAELDVASNERSYLKNVIRPYRQMLSSLWVASLRDYACIRGDSETLQDGSTTIMDSSFVALGREVLLPYYAIAWLPIMKAVANALLNQEPSVLSALDGVEASSTHRPASDSEPKALFYVLFGLAFETLLGASADVTSASAARETAMTALNAMRSLVQPRCSGRAILEPAIFNEFTSLCYRMAITETASVQVHLISVIVSFIQSQRGNIQSIEVANGTDVGIQSESPLMHCLRICCYILRQNIPQPNTPFTLNEGNQPADRTNLLSVAFSSCSLIGEAMGPHRKEDARAVALSLYSDLLRSEACDWDIIGPTLPSLKVLLQSPSNTEATKAEYGRLVHGLLSSCVLNVNDMRGREGMISTLKVKNNLLAVALSLSVIPPDTTLSKPLVEYCCSLISQKLEDDEASLTAAHCCKTIMLASTSTQSNPALKHCLRLLIPGMIRFVASTAAESTADTQTFPDSKRQALDEVSKAFNSFFGVIPEEHKSRMLGILLPTFILLLGSENSSAPRHALGVQSLLQLASSAPQAFKEATGKLEQQQRSVLENALREALAGSSSSTISKVAKPTIALKSF